MVSHTLFKLLYIYHVYHLLNIFASIYSDYSSGILMRCYSRNLDRNFHIMGMAVALEVMFKMGIAVYIYS